MHNVLGAKGSARDHEEGRGDQGPQGEADELLFLGFRWGGALRPGLRGDLRDDLRFPGWRARGSCQFRCGPPKRLTLTTSAVAAEAPGNCDSRHSGKLVREFENTVIWMLCKKNFQEIFSGATREDRARGNNSRGGKPPASREGKRHPSLT
jgi:hypothetical protein